MNRLKVFLIKNFLYDVITNRIEEKCKAYLKRKYPLWISTRENIRIYTNSDYNMAKHCVQSAKEMCLPLISSLKIQKQSI